ncbi:triple tyrosine motif-containing protein [Phenylobacterium sp. LjRoot225]|uniref:sensor histidine kinase n=1 Tax=Phenylobacterium sp. LjRoot225 TaxID=3342285 RepID=UPI003ECF0081
MQLNRAVLIAAMLLAQPIWALAAEPPRRLAHYTHQRWTEGSESPGPVLGIAQGRDGYLWLATGEGLFRFDGINFERIDAADGEEAQGSTSALLVARNGDVWTNFDASGRFAIYRAGALRLVKAPAVQNRIIAFAEGLDGAIWALTARYDGEVLRYHGGRWRLFDARQGLPLDDAFSMLVAADGAVWISFGNSVMRAPAGAERFETVRKTPGANGKLSQDPAGRIWLSEARGSYPLTGSGGRGPPPRLRAPYRTDDSQIRGAPMFDRAGNLWIARRYDGVQHLASAKPTGPGSTADADVESFRKRDGLSSDVTNQVFEDREGNVWIGTERGLDKFRPATLRAEPELTAPAAFGDKLMQASDGSVYIGEARTIYRVAPGGEPTPILRNVREPQSICESPDGSVWIAYSRRIVVWKGGRIRQSIERPNTGSLHGIIYDCAFDARGDYWYAAGGEGLYQYKAGRWTAMFGPTDVNDFYPMTLVDDPQRRLIVQWGRRDLAWIDYPARTVIPLNFGTAPQRVSAPVDFGEGGPQPLTVYAPGKGDVFVAGAFGLSRFRAGRFETVWPDRRPRNRRISGMVQTAEGDIWIAFPTTLERFRSQDLDRAFANGVLPPPTVSLGFGDGLTSRTHSHTQRSIVRGGDGRLWIATETGTVWMDPARIVRDNLPPSVAIRSLTADRRFYRDPAALELRAATSNVEIDYAVLSFADPRRARVRYKLEGFDEAWLDPGARRQAFYTNLPPGKYRFRVIAANAEGVWNRAGAVVDFEIPPTFLQSRGFLALCVGLGLLLFWGFYRFRVTQVADRIRTELEARLQERERIARELHDTLLQSVQGLTLRFQSVANKMPPGDRSKELLETALMRADDVIVDGRNRVRDLRVADDRGDLAYVLKAAVDAAGFDPSIPVRISVEGAPRAIHPMVLTEIGRITGEALFNIALHAKAQSVEIAASFGEHQLTLRIRDDGVGIAPDVLAAGQKPGHFGLVGMRERAERIGGTLCVESASGSGTAVKLTVPARLAFMRRRTGRRLSSLFRLRKGAAGA